MSRKALLGRNANGLFDPCDDTSQILGSQGPVSSGTRADYVKFHDDKVSTAFDDL